MLSVETYGGENKNLHWCQIQEQTLCELSTYKAVQHTIQ